MHFNITNKITTIPLSYNGHDCICYLKMYMSRQFYIIGYIMLKIQFMPLIKEMICHIFLNINMAFRLSVFGLLSMRFFVYVNAVVDFYTMAYRPKKPYNKHDLMILLTGCKGAVPIKNDISFHKETLKQMGCNLDFYPHKSHSSQNNP